uniref:Uncharacterized protein n=1 Tax=Rhizophora mucronata TaxID=61149 RepID=A0A2P2QLH8_RHIMU
MNDFVWLCIIEAYKPHC